MNNNNTLLDSDNSMNKKLQNKKPARVTDDGFKIVSSIPEDDSDVSDAFESDLSEDEGLPPSKKKSPDSKSIKVTDDGFKIVSSIPEDDSDVSDAFESDLSEDEGLPPSKKKSPDSKSIKVTDDGFKIVTSIPKDDSDVSDAFESDISDDESGLPSSRIKDIATEVAKSKHGTNGTVNNNSLLNSNHESISMESSQVKLQTVSSSVSENSVVSNGVPKLKRKRGRKKKKGDASSPHNTQSTISINMNKRKKKKSDNLLPMTEEEIENFKANISPKLIKFIEGFKKFGE